jgi:S-DNA-T family DNA segregation ATPase FtsK/SpoIIIE
MHVPPFRKESPFLNDSSLSPDQGQDGNAFSHRVADDDLPPLPEPIPAVELDPDKLPTWQRAFILGPNVRFTRTPGRPPAHPSSASPSPSDPSPEPADGQAMADCEAGSPVTDLQQQIVEAFVAPVAPATVHVPHHADKQASVILQRTQSSRVPDDLRQGPAQAERVVAAAVPAEPQVQAAAGEAVTKSVAPSRRMTGIPDHLIWEMMSLGASENIEPRQPAAVRVGVEAQPSTPTVTAPTAPAVPPAVTIESPAPVQVPEPVVVTAAPATAQEEASPVHLYRQVAVRVQSDAGVHVPQPVETEQTLVAEPVVVEAEPVQLAAAAVPARARRSVPTDDYLFPSVDLLQHPVLRETEAMTQEALEQSAGLLESILEDFGVKGEIIDVRPGPVVTLYEFAPAPGVKSSRVINLSDDIARSMSALSARVAVIPGRNVIGIELPNAERETVYFRELIESHSYIGTDYRLPLCLGKTIGGEPVIAELAKMPHLLVAGTTGSGKSVAINTMILSLIYHLRPEECRLIMVDPKMLELSVYDGIPHLLTPVVTDPKKAVLALKWAVREMEDRYRNMSRLGVRNIDGFNERVAEARARGETIMISVPVGFDRSTGEQIFEDQELDLTALPYIVVIVDEMADLMMVAGKEIEGAIQRLAQMARAAGIHLIMATQRPSVDVITGTIKANFPTRISFQVTSKIDSRTILGEQGAEHLLGQGDMLHMKGGGRISRVHGPFVSDHEVEKVVAHLKTQGQPSYLGSVTEDAEEGPVEEEEDAAVFDQTAMGGENDNDDLYERAVKVVQRDKKCSTSYIQRRLSIGYNRAASLVERMEKEGLVGAPNHVGKREILTQQPVRSAEE